MLICVRGQCAEANKGKRLEQQLLALIEQHGLDDPDHPHHTTCQITNCLAVCSNGPVMIVHPDGIKYQQVDEAALRLIFQQHLLNDQPVTALQVTTPPSRPILGKPTSGRDRYTPMHSKPKKKRR